MPSLFDVFGYCVVLRIDQIVSYFFSRQLFNLFSDVYMYVCDTYLVCLCDLELIFSVILCVRMCPVY